MELVKFTTRIPKSVRLMLEREAIKARCTLQELAIEKLSVQRKEPDRMQEGRILYSRIQSKARVAVKKALLNGRLTKQNCEVCESPRSYAHHDDYLKPLDVKWLCASHHRRRHRELQDAGIDTWSEMKKYGFKTFFGITKK